MIGEAADRDIPAAASRHATGDVVEIACGLVVDETLAAAERNALLMMGGLAKGSMLVVALGRYPVLPGRRLRSRHLAALCLTVGGGGG